MSRNFPETYVLLEDVQGGKDALGAVICRSLSAKEPIIVGLICGERPTNIRHLLPLCHPVTCRCKRAVVNILIRMNFCGAESNLAREGQG